MRLYGSQRSPFVRKVLIAVEELGLADQIVFVPVIVSSTQADEALVRLNPLGEAPTLVTDDGTPIHDSLVICEFLDDHAGGQRLIPASGPARWNALTRHAVGNGMIETLVKLFAERKRTGDPRHPIYVEALTRKFRQTLPALEAQCAARPARPFDLGDIALGCALAYADFRFAELNWREGHPALARHYAAIAARPSVRAHALSGEGTKD